MHLFLIADLQSSLDSHSCPGTIVIVWSKLLWRMEWWSDAGAPSRSRSWSWRNLCVPRCCCHPFSMHNLNRCGSRIFLQDLYLQFQPEKSASLQSVGTIHVLLILIGHLQTIAEVSEKCDWFKTLLWACIRIMCSMSQSGSGRDTPAGGTKSWMYIFLLFQLVHMHADVNLLECFTLDLESVQKLLSLLTLAFILKLYPFLCGFEISSCCFIKFGLSNYLRCQKKTWKKSRIWNKSCASERKLLVQPFLQCKQNSRGGTFLSQLTWRDVGNARFAGWQFHNLCLHYHWFHTFHTCNILGFGICHCHFFHRRFIQGLTQVQWLHLIRSICMFLWGGVCVWERKREAHRHAANSLLSSESESLGMNFGVLACGFAFIGLSARSELDFLHFFETDPSPPPLFEVKVITFSGTWTFISPACNTRQKPKVTSWGQGGGEAQTHKKFRICTKTREQVQGGGLITPNFQCVQGCYLECTSHEQCTHHTLPAQLYSALQGAHSLSACCFLSPWWRCHPWCLSTSFYIHWHLSGLHPSWKKKCASSIENTHLEPKRLHVSKLSHSCPCCSCFSWHYTQIVQNLESNTLMTITHVHSKGTQEKTHRKIRVKEKCSE